MLDKLLEIQGLPDTGNLAETKKLLEQHRIVTDTVFGDIVLYHQDLSTVVVSLGTQRLLTVTKERVLADWAKILQANAKDVCSAMCYLFGNIVANSFQLFYSNPRAFVGQDGYQYLSKDIKVIRESGAFCLYSKGILKAIREPIFGRCAVLKPLNRREKRVWGILNNHFDVAQDYDIS